MVSLVTKNGVEYVRTDAFIEKTCVKLKRLMYDNLAFQGRLHREEIIENFVGEFKKYMKGRIRYEKGISTNRRPATWRSL